MAPEEKIAKVLERIKNEASINPNPRLVKFSLNYNVVCGGTLSEDEERRILFKLEKEGAIELSLNESEVDFYKPGYIEKEVEEPREVTVISSDKADEFLSSPYYWVKVLDGFEEVYKRYAKYLKSKEVRNKKKNKTVNKKDGQFPGIFIAAKKIINQGEISSKGPNYRTEIITEDYKGTGSVKAEDSKNPKLKNPSIILPLLVLIVAIISIPWWPQIFDFFQKNTANFQVNDQLRTLELSEVGKKITQLPNNVYFFDFANAVAYELESSLDDFIDAKGYRMSDDCFEIQKVDNRYYIIGFVNDDVRYQKFIISTNPFENIDFSDALDVVVFPYPWGGSENAVGIPFDSVSSISYREISIDQNLSINVLDVNTKEIVINVIPHELPSFKNKPLTETRR